MPRSFANGVLTAAVLFSLIFCERSLAAGSRTALIMRWICGAVVGAAAGFQFMILTPLRPWLATILPWPGPVISIGLGSAMGICAGIACVVIGMKWREKLKISIGNSVLLITLLLMLFLTLTALRGGLASLGGAIISSLDMSNCYLWPILYFVGVGIIHKLMGSSKVVAAAVRGLFPEWLLTPALVLVLVTATIGAFSEDAINYLSVQTSEYGQKAFVAFLPVFKTVQFLVWKDPLLSMATHEMKWILLFDVVVVSILAWQKRLTAAAMSRLFFITALLALILWEYIFQMTSFSRGPIHSVLLIWLFAVWLLWLMHTIGWKLSLKSSPLWPSTGRLALYGGIVAILILQVNARAMCSDYRIVNEIFLTMFRGVIDVGLPYYFLLWANKRIKEATPPVGVLLGAYSAGAIASMCFNAIDKCFTQMGFARIVATQLENSKTNGNLSLDVETGIIWLFAKAAIFVGMLALVRRAAFKAAVMENVRVSKKTVPMEKVTMEKVTSAAGDRNVSAHHWMLYMIVAFASGVVSFAYTLVDLPLPTEIRVALAPLRQEVLFNGNVFHYYLAYWISALVFALASIKTDNLAKLIAAALVAIGAGGAILAGYQLFEVPLRASGMFVAFFVVLAAMLVVLILSTLRSLEKPAGDLLVDESQVSVRASDAVQTSQPARASEVRPSEVRASEVRASDALLDYRAMGALAFVSAMLFVIYSYFSPSFKSFSMQEVPSLEHAVVLANDWKLKETVPAKAPYPVISTYAREKLGSKATIQLMSLESDPAGVMKLMQKWISFLQLKVTKIESWNRYSSGAYSFQFTLKNPNGIDLYAVSCFAPRQNRTEVFTLISDVGTIEQSQWELAELVRNLPH